jgi:hypothetical protein
LFEFDETDAAFARSRPTPYAHALGAVLDLSMSDRRACPISCEPPNRLIRRPAARFISAAGKRLRSADASDQRSVTIACHLAAEDDQGWPSGEGARRVHTRFG